MRRPSGQHVGERDPLTAMGTPQGQLSDPFRTFASACNEQNVRKPDALYPAIGAWIGNCYC